MAAWPKNSNAGESTDNTTHIKSSTDKNGNLQTYETQIAVIPNIFPIARCGDHIAATQSKSQLGGTHPHHPMENVQYTCALTRVVSLPPKLSRIAKTVGNHGGPAKELQSGRIPHTSNHVLTRTEIHKNTKHKSLSCIKCSQPNAVATTSWRLKTVANFEAHIVAHQPGNLQYTWETLVVSLPPESSRITRK